MKLAVDPLARTLVRALLAGIPALFLLPATAAAQFQWDCATTPGATACKGDWGPSIELAISCGASPACATRFCNTIATDEIGHAIVVPVSMTVGTTTIEEGSVLLWTRCDAEGEQRGDVAYRCHVFDPDTRTIVAALPFNLPPDIGPFCSGHVWSLDPAGDPKLLTVGGTELRECVADPPRICANGKVYWFDPLVANPERDGWRDDPPDMPLIDPPNPPIYDQVKLWYPSVITYLHQSGSDFAAISLGGSRIQSGGGCGEPVQLTKWWALFFPFSEWIEYEDPSYEWHQYPRTLLLSDNSILSPSSAVVCEGTFPPYGGNPVQRVFPARALQTHAQGPDPNTQVPAFATEAMHYGNAVILHTLKSGWSWNETAPLAEYDLDRVIVSGGAPETFRARGVEFRLTQPHTLELTNATGGSRALWRQKATATRQRMFGNLVILPDGSLLACGGMDRHPFNHADTQWFSSSERFEPLGPLDQGVWTDLDQREIVGSHIRQGPFATLRGYHSSAVLLRDGSVAIFGGEPSIDPGYETSDSVDTVEVFEPPYFFRGPRPRIQSFPETIHYGTTFGITVDNPARVDRACLIGIGAVTHHFDYGQRYLELMIDKTNPPVGNVEVLMPDLPPLAPEGFYLFFVVDEQADGFHMPSEGRFVKVTFGP